MVNSEVQLNNLFSALSDPTRRVMLERLATKEMSVAELSKPFNISKPAVSKHLKVLEKAGLLRRHVEGRVHRCVLVAQPLADVADWVAHYERFWEAKLNQLDAYLSAKGHDNES